MATATNSRRDLYASSEPKPKNTGKKRNASPPKRSSSHKRTAREHRSDTPEITQEELSQLTYQSISLLLDAARMLDEAEKKGTPIPPTVSTSAKTAVPVAAPAAPPVVKATVKKVPKLKKVRKVPATPKKSPVAVQQPIQDDLQTSSSAVAALFTLSTQQPPRTHAPSPAVDSPLPAAALAAAAAAEAASEEPLTVRAYLKPAKPAKAVKATKKTMVEQPSTSSSSFFPRGLAPIPIPADLADIAVPVAPRSVPTVPRKKQIARRKEKTTAQIDEERRRAMNFGYPDECRTRIPDAVRRFIARMDQKRRETGGPLFNNYKWK